MRKWFLKLFSFFILVSLLFLIFWKVGIQEIFDVLLQINFVWLIPFILIFFLNKLFYTFNLRLLLGSLREKVVYKRLLKYYLLMNSIALFFPSRTGELSLPLFLKKNEGFEYGEVLSIQLIDKMITFSVYLLLAFLGLFFVFDLGNSYYFVLIFIFLILVGLFIVVWSKKVRSFLKNYILRKYSKYFKGFSKSFKYILKTRKTILFVNILITFVLLSLNFIGGVIVFRMFAFDISFVSVAVVQSILLIIGLVPFTFSGFGLAQISGIFLYGELGVPYAVSVNYFLFNLLFKYIFGTMIYFGFYKELSKKVKIF